MCKTKFVPTGTVEGTLVGRGYSAIICNLHVGSYKTFDSDLKFCGSFCCFTDI